MVKRLVLSALLFGFSASYVHAQGISIGPMVDYMKTKGADSGDFLYGASVRLKLFEALAIDASIAYRQNKVEDGLYTVRTWPIMVTGMLYPLPFLYGAMGAGWYNTTMDYNQSKLPPGSALQDETTRDYGWHFGGGLEIPFGKRARLYGDVRWVYLNYDFKSFPGSEGTESDFYMINAGVLFIL